MFEVEWPKLECSLYKCDVFVVSIPNVCVCMRACELAHLLGPSVCLYVAAGYSAAHREFLAVLL